MRRCAARKARLIFKESVASIAHDVRFALQAMGTVSQGNDLRAHAHGDGRIGCQGAAGKLLTARAFLLEFHFAIRIRRRAIVGFGKYGYRGTLDFRDAPIGDDNRGKTRGRGLFVRTATRGRERAKQRGGECETNSRSRHGRGFHLAAGVGGNFARIATMACWSCSALVFSTESLVIQPVQTSSCDLLSKISIVNVFSS